MVFSVLYDEGNPSSYKGVQIKSNDFEYTFTNFGEFYKDWFDLYCYVVKNELKYGIICGSSVNQFVKDSKLYDSAYLYIMDGKEAYLWYHNTTIPDWLLNYSKTTKGIEFFVPRGTKPTWKEFKKLCVEK